MVWTDYSWYVYINGANIVSALIWFTVLIILAYAKANKMATRKLGKLYMQTMYYKMGFAILFGLVYILIIGGGDTLAYFEASRIMHNKFFLNPEEYFEQIFTYPLWENYYKYFNPYVGYPPSFIYREPESYFVSKVTTLLSFATFNSYFATCLIYASLTANASWRLYMMVRRKKIFNPKYLAIAFLFLPSVAFWTSGVSKDGLVFFALLNLIYHLFKVFDSSQKSGVLNYLGILLFSFLIYNSRDFIFYATIGSFVLMKIIVYLYKQQQQGFIFKVISQTTISVLLLGSLYAFVLREGASRLTEGSAAVQEAKITQQDFEQNKEYGGNRYSLGTVEYTPVGMLKALPLSVLTGIYRPLPHEATSPLILINGIESIFFIWLTFLSLRSKNFREKFRYIRTNEILMFSLIFVIIVGFMAGFSSIIFGVLVRLRVPILPFVIILLSINWKKILEDIKKKKIKAQEASSQYFKQL